MADFKPQTGSRLSVGLDSERLIHQWRDIFRYGTGDRVLIFNGEQGEWLVEFVSLDRKNGAVIEFVEQNLASTKRQPASHISLYMAIIKNSNFDLVVEKATELGVSKIVPVKTERTVKSGLNFDRLNKLAIEAAEQSGRMSVPEISESTSIDLEEAIREAKGETSEGSVYFGHISDAPQPDTTVETGPSAIFIGPEGGWTDEEVAVFTSEGIKPLSLGQFVLRAETAAIVGVSKLANK